MSRREHLRKTFVHLMLRSSDRSASQIIADTETLLRYVLDEPDPPDPKLRVTIRKAFDGCQYKNALLRAGLETVNDIVKLTPTELEAKKGIGENTAARVSYRLEQMGISWGAL